MGSMFTVLLDHKMVLITQENLHSTGLMRLTLCTLPYQTGSVTGMEIVTTALTKITLTGHLTMSKS